MVTNKNNHTTSTKCQYQAAASNPKCCVGDETSFCQTFCITLSANSILFSCVGVYVVGLVQ